MQITIKSAPRHAFKVDEMGQWVKSCAGVGKICMCRDTYKHRAIKTRRSKASPIKQSLRLPDMSNKNEKQKQIKYTFL